MYQRLPNSVSVQYSELMQNCVRPVSDGSNLSFKYKTINGKRYWYLYIGLGKTRREHYLGAETQELLDQIEREKALWVADDDDRQLRRRLVDMLIAGGMSRLSVDEGKVLALLERNGVFLAGAVLVGTLAFRAYANMLGVTWKEDTGTQDVDIGADKRYLRALPRPKNPIDLEQLILDSGLGYVPVPTLNAKEPSTSFRIRNRDFRIDALAPVRGQESARPIRLDAFQTHATPLRHLDFLLEDFQPAVLLYQHGVLVNVPPPGRFAVHMCAVSQKRSIAFASKTQKDLRQAEQVFEALLDIRPSEISLALDAAHAQGTKFADLLEKGLDRIDPELARLVRKTR